MTGLFIYNTVGQLVCKHYQHKSMIKLQKLRILMWNLSLITFTSNSQKVWRKLNKSSLPALTFILLSNHHLINMLRVGDNNHMLHEYDINHQGLLSIHPMLSVNDVSAYLWTFYLVHISAQLSLSTNSLNSTPSFSVTVFQHCYMFYLLSSVLQ